MKNRKHSNTISTQILGLLVMTVTNIISSKGKDCHLNNAYFYFVVVLSGPT